MYHNKRKIAYLCCMEETVKKKIIIRKKQTVVVPEPSLPPEKPRRTQLAKHLFENNISQKELSHLTGIDTISINQYCTGRRNMGVVNAKIIASVLGLKVDDILDDYEKKKRN